MHGAVPLPMDVGCRDFLGSRGAFKSPTIIITIDYVS